MGKKWYNLFVVSDTPAAEPAGAAEPSERPRRVEEVVADVPQEATFTTPVANAAEFIDIYESAQIETPAHGYTVLKVADMLTNEHIRDLPADVKRKSVLVALDAAGVKIAAIIEDAVRRDRALDTYEHVMQKAFDQLITAKEAENREIENEINERIKALREQVAQNKAEIDQEQQQLVAWRTRKRAEEQRIAEAVGYFVSENPITTGNVSASDKGGSTNVR
jgi:hypothetical protein